MNTLGASCGQEQEQLLTRIKLANHGVRDNSQVLPHSTAWYRTVLYSTKIGAIGT
ncbi:MAG: hypothetical protein WBX01_13435 [Nitrososphaeraceae archaeon]